MSIENVENEFKALFNKTPEEAANDLKSLIEEKSGPLPFAAECLLRRPEVYVGYVGLSKDIYLTPKNIPLKWAELITVGITFALKSEHCAKVHIEKALKAGATIDEIWDTMIIADIMSITHINSIACRLMEQSEKAGKENAPK